MTVSLERPPKNEECYIVSSMATDPALLALRRIDITEPGCWIWPGAKTTNGYGHVQGRPPYVEKPRPLLVHRVLYEYFIEDIPEGKELDHLCRVRLCCNPTHLEPVTRSVNTRRGAHCVKGSCPQGHEYPKYVMLDSKGYVRCRECNRLRTAAWKEKQRVALS